MNRPSPVSERVLLVHLPVAGGYRGTIVAPFVEVLPPLGLLAIVPSLRESGAAATILDLNLAGDPDAALELSLSRLQPTVVGLSILTPQVPVARKLVRIIRRRRPETVIWGGGVHPSIFPRESIDEIDLDGVVVGEGDFTWAEALATRPGDRGRTAGVVFRVNGAVDTGPAPRPISSLDSLPIPAWDAVQRADYARRGLLGQRPAAAPVETSRGCALACSFCTKAIFGRRFRAKSPERVVAEFRRVKALGFGEAHVLDDCFNTSIGRAREICERLLAGRVGLPWNCRVGIRADRVDADLFRAMRAAGCTRVSIGIESGSQAVLDEAGKRLRLEEGERAVRLASEAQVETMAFFVLGLPAETAETLEATIRHARRLRPTFAKFALFTPLPSTPAWAKLESEGRLAIRSWGDLNFHRLPPRSFRHPNLTPGELTRAYLKAYAVFYLDARGWARRARAWLERSPSGAPEA